MDVLDGHRQGTDPEVLGQLGGISQAPLAREARRHEHAGHVLGAEGSDGDGGHQRGVDAAGEADDHVGEPVLGHVVAGAEHERLPHLGLGPQAGFDAGGLGR